MQFPFTAGKRAVILHGTSDSLARSSPAARRDPSPPGTPSPHKPLLLSLPSPRTWAPLLNVGVQLLLLD